jgi:hypothetical protein
MRAFSSSDARNTINIMTLPAMFGVNDASDDGTGLVSATLMTSDLATLMASSSRIHCHSSSPRVYQAFCACVSPTNDVQHQVDNINNCSIRIENRKLKL